MDFFVSNHRVTLHIAETFQTFASANNIRIENKKFQIFANQS